MFPHNSSAFPLLRNSYVLPLKHFLHSGSIVFHSLAIVLNSPTLVTRYLTIIFAFFRNSFALPHNKILCSLWIIFAFPRNNFCILSQVSYCLAITFVFPHNTLDLHSLTIIFTPPHKHLVFPCKSFALA